MMLPTDLILVSTFHDPNFILKKHLLKALPAIKQMFPLRIVCLTPTTDRKVGTFLEKMGFSIVFSPSMKQVDTYKTAFETSLKLYSESGKSRIFYIDFDRLIHWVNNYPKELLEVLNKYNEFEYLLIGRSKRAWETHPETQKYTEIIVNEMGSRILGFPQTRDIISVCWTITKDLIKRLLNSIDFSKTTPTGFYCTWPIYFWKWSLSRKYIEVDGHEWETPDRFHKEIEEIGYKQWLENFQNPAEWKKRVQMLRDCLTELNTLEF